MLKAGVLKLVQETTPWINSFVLIKGTDKQGQPKLCICLDPMNLNKAIIREPVPLQDTGGHCTLGSQFHCDDHIRL